MGHLILLHRIPGSCFCLCNCHGRSCAHDNLSVLKGKYFQLWMWSYAEEFESDISAGKDGRKLKVLLVTHRNSFRFQQAWKWGGCSADINYGMKFSRKFLDVREVEGDTRTLMNLQNNKVGRKVRKERDLRNNCSYQLNPLSCPCPDSEASLADGMQMPWRIRILCDEDVLAYIAAFSCRWRYTNAKVQQSSIGWWGTTGSGVGEQGRTKEEWIAIDLQETWVKVVAFKEDADAEEIGVGLYCCVAQLLWWRLESRIPGHLWKAV